MLLFRISVAPAANLYVEMDDQSRKPSFSLGEGLFVGATYGTRCIKF
jgi:hypothetical protein